VVEQGDGTVEVGLHGGIAGDGEVNGSERPAFMAGLRLLANGGQRREGGHEGDPEPER
jgi:hypothetical protein